MPALVGLRGTVSDRLLTGADAVLLRVARLAWPIGLLDGGEDSDLYPVIHLHLGLDALAVDRGPGANSVRTRDPACNEIPAARTSRVLARTR